MGQRLVVEGHKVYKRPYFRILTKMPNNVDYIHRVRDSVGLLEADSQKFYTRKIGYSSDSQKIKIYEKVVSKNKRSVETTLSSRCYDSVGRECSYIEYLKKRLRFPYVLSPSAIFVPKGRFLNIAQITRYHASNGEKNYEICIKENSLRPKYNQKVVCRKYHRRLVIYDINGAVADAKYWHGTKTTFSSPTLKQIMSGGELHSKTITTIHRKKGYFSTYVLEDGKLQLAKEKKYATAIDTTIEILGKNFSLDSRESINTRVLTYKDGSQVLLYRNYSPGREIIRDTMVFANGDKYPIRTQLYNEKGKLLCKKDLQNSLEYEYDSVGRKIMSLSNGVKTEYKYDEKGNTILIKSDTTTTEMEYDSLNRLVAKTINGVRKEYIKQTPKQEIVDSKSTKQEVVVQKSEMAETKTATQPVKPISKKDSVYVAKRMQLERLYGQCDWSAGRYPHNVEKVVVKFPNNTKWTYLYVDSLQQLFLIQKSTDKQLSQHNRMKIDTIYSWNDSAIASIKKECSYTDDAGNWVVFFRCHQYKNQIDTMMRNLSAKYRYESTYERDTVSNQWVLTEKKIENENTNTTVYEYQKSSYKYIGTFFPFESLSSHVSFFSRKFSDSTTNSWLSVDYIKKENEPDSSWILTELSGQLYDTVRNEYLYINSYSPKDSSLDIYWWDTLLTRCSNTIRCKLLPNGVITPVGYSVDTQLKPRNFSTHINYEWNSEDSSFHVADSVMMYQGRVVGSKEEYKRLLDYELNTPTYTLEELKAYVRYNAIVFIKTKKKTFPTQPAESWIRKYEADGFKTLKDW